jgi:protein-disulfide isomerase
MVGAQVKGSADAPVGIMEFSDFQCPYCGVVARDTVPAVIEKYVVPGTVLFAFRHFPLDKHERAKMSALTAACAGSQGRFWSVHDTLFGDQAELPNSAEDVQRLARALTLRQPDLSRCVGDAREQGAVQSDVALGKRLGIAGTPTFLLGTMEGRGELRVKKILVGAVSLQDFDAAISAVRTARGVQ